MLNILVLKKTIFKFLKRVLIVFLRSKTNLTSKFENISFRTAVIEK